MGGTDDAPTEGEGVVAVPNGDGFPTVCPNRPGVVGEDAADAEAADGGGGSLENRLPPGSDVDVLGTEKGWLGDGVTGGTCPKSSPEGRAGFEPKSPPVGGAGGVNTGGGSLPSKPPDAVEGVLVLGPVSEGVVEVGLSGTGDADFAGGVGDGVSVKGAGLGGAGGAPNREGGVLGRDKELAAAGMAGDADRAFFVAEGEASGASSSSSSSSPLIGRFARGELRTGRVDGLPAARKLVEGVVVGGADDARSMVAENTFATTGS